MDPGFAPPTATSQAGARNNELGLGDACCLKSDPSRLGYVLRTPYDVDDHGPLADITIIPWPKLPETDLMRFMATGVPPKGYVFVGFCESPLGCSLIHVDDLELIDRPLVLGMTVKRQADDTMVGMTISATTEYTLEPIAFQPVDPITGDCLPIRFTERPFGNVDGPPTTEDPEVDPRLIYGVRQSDIIGIEEFSEDDYIVYRQKLGKIVEVERDAVLLLPDSGVISPLDPSALELPLRADPQLSPTLPGATSHNLGNGKHMLTLASHIDDISPGQFILTETSNISRKHLPPGHQGPVVQAYVLATPIEDIHIDWLCPNVFSTRAHERSPDREVLRLSALQGKAVKCNFGQPPTQGSPESSFGSVLDIGERVRFRDPINAAINYPGYCHIPVDQSFGYDLNIYRIVSSKTEVVVRWQDGSCSTEAAVSLRTCGTFEDHLWPGKFTALKDSIKAVDEAFHTDRSSLPYSSRDRMEGTLHVPKVGVIQAVDSRDQIASVRWFQNSNVELIKGGNALSPRSSLGQLSDTVTKVSAYELATLSALNKALDNLVILVPTSVDRSAISPSSMEEANPAASSRRKDLLAPDIFSSFSNYLQSMKSEIVASEWFKETTTIRAPPLRRRYSIQSDESMAPVDFFGAIVAMDTSGIITVRLPGAPACRDIQVPLERILAVIDWCDPAPPIFLSPPETPTVESAGPSSSRDYSLASQAYESRENDYPDGNIIDLDPNTKVTSHGITDLDDPVRASYTIVGIGKLGESGVSEIRLDSPETPCREAPLVDDTAPPVSPQPRTLPILRFAEPISCPPSFAILEDSPPSDHHFIASSNSGALGARLKRIQKEFEILKTSLPLGIFVRTWESRMDLLRIMFIGPQGTPYEYAPFVIDMSFNPDFPSHPPSAFFHAWSAGQGSPINPNLYNDGRICLSLLGTWQAQNTHEAWSSEKSTVLQILVSILGLVLVKAPFYNEAGYETLAAEGSGSVESSQYTEKAFLMSRKYILHALVRPVRGLEDVLIWNYLPSPSSTRPQLLRKAIEEALKLIEHHNRTTSQENSQELRASEFLSRLSVGAAITLQKHVESLQKLKSDIDSSRCLLGTT
ncbi:ubiquitin-conjugating enzyme E2 [Aspergillus lucknowensis]|uniref:UBC core domain-containing protein n=1 Tax=Aspergillus lucknowensis TaxID=176173 RepID=A0ABR4LGJ1_9EURO